MINELGTLPADFNMLIERGYKKEHLPKRFNKGMTAWYFITLDRDPMKSVIGKTTILDDGKDERMIGWSYMCEDFSNQTWVPQTQLFSTLQDAKDHAIEVYEEIIETKKIELHYLHATIDKIVRIKPDITLKYL